MRYTAIALLLWCAAAQAADISSKKQDFTLVCVGEQATGFNWERDQWRPAIFTPETYVFRKHDPVDFGCDVENETPAGFSEIEWTGTDPKYGTSLGCYSFTDIGEEPAFYTICDENWRADAGALQLTRLSCKGFLQDVVILLTTLQFTAIRTYSYWGMVEVNTPRDSIALQLGKCSFVN